MYKIEKITDKEGNERTDGHYPNRKGSTVELFHLRLDDSMILGYRKDNQGNNKGGLLSTSIVEGFSKYNNTVKIETMNSIYYLTEVSNDNISS